MRSSDIVEDRNVLNVDVVFYLRLLSLASFCILKLKGCVVLALCLLELHRLGAPHSAIGARDLVQVVE